MYPWCPKAKPNIRPRKEKVVSVPENTLQPTEPSSPKSSLDPKKGSLGSRLPQILRNIEYTQYYLCINVSSAFYADTIGH